MVSIKNKQRKILVDIKKIKNEAEKILEITGYPDFDLGIMFVNNKSMQWYNKTYRNKNSVTDILSFPYYPNLKPGKRITVENDDDKNLGDIILAPEYITEEAKRYQVSFNNRLRVLLVHGVCHLLGYDHEKDKDWYQMRAKEGYILKKLHELDR